MQDNLLREQMAAVRERKNDPSRDQEQDFQMRKLKFLEIEVERRHKMEWERHKNCQQMESLKERQKVLRLQVLEVKRMYLESVKENDYLRLRLTEKQGLVRVHQGRPLKPKPSAKSSKGVRILN